MTVYLIDILALLLRLLFIAVAVDRCTDVLPPGHQHRERSKDEDRVSVAYLVAEAVATAEQAVGDHEHDSLHGGGMVESSRMVECWNQAGWLDGGIKAGF